MLEYLSPSQCRSSGSSARTGQQEPEVLPTCNTSSWGKIKRVKCLELFLASTGPCGFPSRGKVLPGRICGRGEGLGWVTLSHGSGTRCRRDGWSREGPAVWDEQPRDELPWTLRYTELFLSLSVSPFQCLSQGSTNEVSGSCSPHAAGASRALSSWQKHPGPKSTFGLVEDGSHQGSGCSLGSRCLGKGVDVGTALQEPSGTEIWLGNVRM